MKNINWIINGILGIAVLVLYFLHFNGGSTQTSKQEATTIAGQETKKEKADEDKTENTSGNTSGNTTDTLTDAEAIAEGELAAEELDMDLAESTVYVDIRRLDDEYNFIVNSRKELDKKAKALEQNLAEWRGNLEKKAQEAQKKAMDGKMSEEEMMSVQRELMKQQQDFAKYADEESQKLMGKREELNERMFENIGKFMKGFAQKKRIKLVFAYDEAGAGGILYADPSLDVTDAVIMGLNKRYGK